MIISMLKRKQPALARRLSWLEHSPMHQTVGGLILSQGTYMGGNQSMSHSLFFPPSLLPLNQ